MTDKQLLPSMAAEEAIASHSVGIIAHAGKAPGSGTLLRWRGRTIILTAWHVVEGSDRGAIRFLLRPAGTLTRQYLEDKRPAAGAAEYQLSKNLPIGRIASSSEEDVAFLEILGAPPEPDSAVSLYAVGPNEVSLMDAGRTVAFMGYPVALAQTVVPGQSALSPMFQFLRVCTDPGGLSTFDGTRHFLMDYHLGSDVNPYGFSGAGVWAYDHPTSKIWYPNIRLSGIVVAHLPNRKMLRAVKIETAIKLLHTCFPDSLED
jgi:hypothetical protein